MPLENLPFDPKLWVLNLVLKNLETPTGRYEQERLICKAVFGREELLNKNEHSVSTTQQCLHC